MIVASFQGPVALGDPEANIRTIEKTLQQAEAQKAEIVCMPETFLHGYFSKEADARQNAVDLDGRSFAELLRRLAQYRPTLIVGLNELRGGKLFNTAVVIENGKLVGRYSKNYLVYQYFQRGHDFPIFHRRGIAFGVVICADTSYIEPARILAMKGAQILFTPHFNYIQYGNLDDHTWRVRQHHIAIAIDNDVYVVRSNVVVPESQGAAHFGYAGVGVGDALILNRRGRVLAQAGLSTTTLLVCDIPDADLKPKARPWQRTSPLIAQALWEQYQQLFAQHANDDGIPAELAGSAD